MPSLLSCNCTFDPCPEPQTLAYACLPTHELPSQCSRAFTHYYRTVFKHCREVEQLFSQNRNYHRHYRQYTVQNVVTNRNQARDNT